MTGSAAPLNDRGIDVCRGCRADGLVSVLDLGDQPLANEMAHVAGHARTRRSRCT